MQARAGAEAEESRPIRSASSLQLAATANNLQRRRRRRFRLDAVRVRHRRERLGQELAGRRYAGPRAGPQAERRRSAAGAAPQPARRERSSTGWWKSINRRSAARRAPTRPRTRACGTTSAACSPARKQARQRGYGIGRFSFNTKGGRCEECEGQGVRRIAMNFLPDLEVTCPVCHGARFNRQTLAVKFRDRSIADVLAMSIDEAVEFFENHEVDPPAAGDARRRGAGLSHAGPAVDDAFRRRSAADQAGHRARPAGRRATRCTFSTSRRPACTATTSAGCWPC